MKSDAITFPKATLDQATREAFDFSGHSFRKSRFLYL
jgi:hypothetical protein